MKNSYQQAEIVQLCVHSQRSKSDHETNCPDFEMSYYQELKQLLETFF